MLSFWEKGSSFIMQFRKDINALRTIAVLAVIAFHFNNNYLPGGFAGVDIFFVISGYLMTRIILSGIDENQFSLKRFYLARAKRIIPALTITCLIVMIIGWLFVKPSGFYDMGKDVLSSIFFFSNFLYLSRTGYFDDSSVNNFLLHTWSLSVEWQFYIIYPLILLSIHKLLGTKAAKVSITAMLILSLCASLYGTYNYAEASYYMFPTRSWAMLAGGLAYILPQPRSMKRTLNIAGFLIITISFFIINKTTPWPGVMAILPVFGTFLCIYSNSNMGFYKLPPLQFIGSISYEIYLIHWPLLVFMHKVGVNINFTWYTLATIVISIILSNSLKMMRLDKKFSMAFTACFAFCLFIIFNNGYPERVPEQFRLTNSEFHRKYYGGANYTSNKVIYINSNENNFDYIITGDSFGLQYAKSFDDKKIKFAGLFDHGCLIFPNYSRYLANKEDISCSEEYEKLKSIMDKAPAAPLIFASAWDNYNGKLIKKGDDAPIQYSKEEYHSIILSEILSVINSGGNKRVYYIIGRPQFTKVNGFDCLAAESLLGYKLISNCQETLPKENVDINKYLKEHLASNENVKFIDPNDILCNKKECKIIYNREPVYSDGSHLSVYGADLVSSYIMEQF